MPTHKCLKRKRLVRKQPPTLLILAGIAFLGTVANVYPDFQDSVVLIDVDVYVQSNKNILRRERLQSIPTLSSASKPRSGWEGCARR
jgi:hypothetical protein